MRSSPWRRVIASLALICGLISEQAFAESLTGQWQSDLPGGVMSLRLEQRGNAVNGVIESGGRLIANLSGTAQGDSARGVASSPQGSGTFELEARRDALSLVLAQEAGPNQQAARLPLEFRRVSASVSGGAAGSSAPRAGGAEGVGGDPRLVGQWSSQDVIVSSGASFAAERFLAFGPDGSVSFSRGRAAAGGAGWSFDGGAGGGAERGRWRARDGVLFVERPDGQWARVGRYGMTEDGRTMRIIDDGGGRTLWSRR